MRLMSRARATATFMEAKYRLLERYNLIMVAIKGCHYPNQVVVDFFMKKLYLSANFL